jgi:GntR family transcriptional regulator
MDFTFDKHSPLPAYVQLQEQIKLALLLGRLRPGDTLPSIRDVEKQAGINRNIVRKAYLALQASGILKLWHGKGVIVDKDLRYGENAQISKKCEELSREILSRTRQMGVSPTSFVRYLHQHARENELQQPFVIYVDSTQEVARERAANISAVWQTIVPAMSIAALKEMGPSRMKKISKVLTNYLRYDEVVAAVDNQEIDVLPLGLTFEQVTVREWSAIPSGAAVAYVMDDHDYPALTLILAMYRKILLDPSIEITAVAIGHIPDLKKFVNSRKYQKVIFSNRVWEDLPDALKRHSRVTHARMNVDLGSLENARIRAGVIL